MRCIIFLSLVGLIAASIYLLKHPEILTKHAGKKVVQPAPVMKEKRFSIKLYFADTQSDYLIGESRSVIFQEGDTAGNVKKIIEELIKGPKTNLIQTMPRGTALQGIALKGTTLVVLDFSPELARNHPGGSLAEMQTIYSIVNSILLTTPSLKELQILVDGQSRETLKGHIDLRAPLKANLSLIKKG
ncbi:MAG: GerMN domain-containing protein [Thermodesulfobacteriota bacterium]|nr:MAG: GerMN domain-containing protein [Thermodesulfobacteriota bacterium]